MKKYGLLTLVLLVAFSSVALAAALQQNLVSVAPGGDQDEMASGRCIVIYVPGENKTIFQMNAQGLTPGATYYPGSFGGGGFDQVVAGPNGKIQVHAELAGGDYTAGDTGLFRVPGPLVLRAE